jgi:hypothetical protein
MPPWRKRFAAAASRSKRCAIVAPQAVKIEAVSKVSTLRKLGVAAQVARQQASRSRTLNAVMSGHAGHQLWLEVTGTVFLLMALSGAGALVHEYSKYTAHQASGDRVALAACFTAVFAWFGLTSFWRVRRKSQRP